MKIQKDNTIFKSYLGNIIVQVIALLMIMIFIGEWGGTEQGYREFRGTVTFDSIPEAIAYQEKVINTALDYNAKVALSDITIVSQPSYSYRVILPMSPNAEHIFSGVWAVALPQNYEFPFGNSESMSMLAFWGLQVFFFILCFGSCGLITWVIWFFKEKGE